MSLSFGSREKLMNILNQFIAFLQSPECKKNVKDLAPAGEEHIEKYIETNQKMILTKNGVNADAGYKDLGKISSIYRADKEVMQLLLMLTHTEEFVTAQASKGGDLNVIQTLKAQICKWNFHKKKKKSSSKKNLCF